LTFWTKIKSWKNFILLWNVCYVKKESQQYVYICSIFDYCVHFAFISCLHVEVLFVCEDFRIVFLCIFLNHVIFYNFLVIMTTLLCFMGFFFLVFFVIFISCDGFVKELWTIMTTDIENNFTMATRLFVLVIMIYNTMF